MREDVMIKRLTFLNKFQNMQVSASQKFKASNLYRYQHFIEVFELQILDRYL